MSNIPSVDELPFTVEAKYEIGQLLRSQHEIPYHSRPFMWTEEKYVGPTTREIIADWNNNKAHWLGVGIIYTGGQIPSVSDMQHRLTICFLMILALSEILEDDEPLEWISKYGTGKRLQKGPSPEENEILEKYDWKRYPNIISVFDYDLEALGNLLNKKEVANRSDSKIYAAYDAITKILRNELQDDTEKDRCENLLQYLMQSVCVVRMRISDWEFVLKVFNFVNNIKVAVPSSYSVRNGLTLATGKSQSEEVHELFTAVEKMERKDYEQNVHTLMNLFAKRIIPEKEYPQAIDKEISKFTGNHLAAFKENFEKLKKILDTVENNRFGKILATMSSGHEVMTLCVIPIAFVLFNKGQHDKLEKLLRQLVSYAIRKGKITFNALKYQTYLHDLMGKILSERLDIDAGLKQLNEYLITWLENDKNDVRFIEKVSTESYKGRFFTYRARPMLLFHTEIKDSLESRLDHSATDIDHIFPKNPSTNDVLEDMELKHKIGNFTPFISQNKEDLKGNKSLGNKSFKNKIEFYYRSNIAMTRDLVDRYKNTDFKDQQIKERSHELAKDFARITAKELGLGVS